MGLKLVKSDFVNELKKNLRKNFVDPKYLDGGISFGPMNVIENPFLDSPEDKKIRLTAPGEDDRFEFQNSVILYEHFKTMTITQATDARIWTYLTHVTFWEYMHSRRPIGSAPEAQRPAYIMRHYFVDPVNARNLLLNDISLLWWGAHLTYDEENVQDPFWLTAEAFSMLDYTRHLLPGSQGRNRNFALAVLQFVLENPKMFKTFKESKVRFIMRKCNFISGYKVLPVMTRKDIIGLISKYKDEIEAVKDEAEKEEPDTVKSP